MSLISHKYRTYSTILRGCLRWCDRIYAEKIITLMEQQQDKIDTNIHQRDICYEYLIKVYCTNLMTTQAWYYSTKINKPTSSIFISIATAEGLNNNIKLTLKAIEIAKILLQEQVNDSDQIIKTENLNLLLKSNNEITFHPSNEQRIKEN